MELRTVSCKQFWSTNMPRLADCYTALRHWKWKDGKNDRDNPRSLFCIIPINLCERNKSLNEVRKQIQIPFILFHKSGVTKDLPYYTKLTMHFINADFKNSR